MTTYTVIESRAYVNPLASFKVSPYGAHPGPGWTLQTVGFTVRNNRTGTVGIGRVPWTNRDDVEAWVIKENARLAAIAERSSL